LGKCSKTVFGSPHIDKQICFLNIALSCSFEFVWWWVVVVVGGLWWFPSDYLVSTQHELWLLWLLLGCNNITNDNFCSQYCDWQLFYALLQLSTFLCTVAITNVFVECYNWNLLHMRLVLRAFVCIIVFWLTIFVCTITIGIF